MADDSKLTKDQKDRALAWLNQKWVGNKACPVCAQNHWTIADHAVTPSISHGSGLIIGGPSYPHALVICNNCGHTLFFNAVLMGILRDEKPAKPEEKTDG
ncbi:MAG: hypothetical protein KJ587_01490 [Alphaproteobacteria bacterium]|nr:hypothetical protein [Alphaproteobacteria bacterium]